MRVIHVLRKPLSEGTVASNVLKHGCGGLNIDASRVAHANPDDLEAHRKMVEAIKARGGSMDNSWKNSSDLSGANDVPTGGRWPANVILQHLDGCRCGGIKRVPSNGNFPAQQSTASWKMSSKGKALTPERSYREDGKEAVANWICAEGCPAVALDKQSGPLRARGNITPTKAGTSGMFFGQHGGNTTPVEGYRDSGGASRFFKQVGGKTE